MWHTLSCMYVCYILSCTRVWHTLLYMYVIYCTVYVCGIQYCTCYSCIPPRCAAADKVLALGNLLALYHCCSTTRQDTTITYYGVLLTVMYVSFQPHQLYPPSLQKGSAHQAYPPSLVSLSVKSTMTPCSLGRTSWNHRSLR